MLNILISCLSLSLFFHKSGVIKYSFVANVTCMIYKFSGFIALFCFIVVDTILSHKYLWNCFQNRKNKDNIK